MDLLFPKENEKELASEAKRLGFGEVIFCYTDEKKIPKTTIEGTKRALLVAEQKQVSKYGKKADMLIGPARREFFEDKRISGIIGVGLQQSKDHTHFRKSLTQVEAKLAKEQKKIIFLNFADVLASKKPEQILGRWAQDKITCKANSLKIVSGASDVMGLRSRKDLENFFKTL